jgi:hypothetical protein
VAIVGQALEGGVRRRVNGPAAKAARLGFFRRRFGKYSALSQYGFPFSWGPYPTSVARFRGLARSTRFAGHGGLTLLAQFVMMLTWPFGALSTALKTAKRMRERRQTSNGAGVFFDIYGLALRHSIPPLEYALYRFDDPERRRDMHEYVYWNDLPGLAALNTKLGAANRDVQDKDRFAGICVQNDFPHVQTLAVFDRGDQVYPVTPFVPTAPELWTKALRLKGGAGGGKWIKDGDSYSDGNGRNVSAAKLAEVFRKQDCIVQPFIENHPVIQSISNGALASLRIVTGMNAEGNAEFVTSLLALPHGGRETSVAGVLCSIATKSGRIQRAALPDGTPITLHPDTGAPIIGIGLPFWRDSIELVCGAHATAFRRFAFLGWDIALTKEGPVLLETNSGWGALFHQMLDGPLGHTAFSRLLEQYV